MGHVGAIFRPHSWCWDAVPTLTLTHTPSCEPHPMACDAVPTHGGIRPSHDLRSVGEIAVGRSNRRQIFRREFGFDCMPLLPMPGRQPRQLKIRGICICMNSCSRHRRSRCRQQISHACSFDDHASADVAWLKVSCRGQGKTLQVAGP